GLRFLPRPSANTTTSESGSEYGSDRIRTASTRPKIAVLAPMPMPRIATTRTAYACRDRRDFHASRRCCTPRVIRPPPPIGGRPHKIKKADSPAHGVQGLRLLIRRERTRLGPCSRRTSIKYPDDDTAVARGGARADAMRP